MREKIAYRWHKTVNRVKRKDTEIFPNKLIFNKLLTSIMNELQTSQTYFCFPNTQGKIKIFIAWWHNDMEEKEVS